MLSAFMAIFGALGGGLLRLSPVLIDAWLNRNAADNELALAQIDLERTRAECEAVARVDAAHTAVSDAQATASAALVQAQAALAAQQAALDAQQAQTSRPVVRWVDALNLAVLPTVTLWLLLLYTLWKTSLMLIAASQHAPFYEIAKIVWDEDDITILSGAVTFWFVDQAISARQPGTNPTRRR